jgi:hypothetical protein
MTNKCNCNCESAGIPVTDNMGREIFWEDIGRQDDRKQ